MAQMIGRVGVHQIASDLCKVAASAVFLAFIFQVNTALAQQREMQFQELPSEVQKHINAVRQSCKELDPDFKPYDAMQGIEVIDLNGDGSRDLLVNNEYVCNGRMAGANCTNRGCDLLLWKQVGGRFWKKIFQEHLYRNFVSINGETRRFQLMAVSIYAEDPRCKPIPRKEYTSGKSCDLLVSYRNGQWVWELIR